MLYLCFDDAHTNNNNSNMSAPNVINSAQDKISWKEKMRERESDKTCDMKATTTATRVRI